MKKGKAPSRRFWPLWNLLDLTPEGRGEGWYPKLAYEKWGPLPCRLRALRVFEKGDVI